MRLTTLFCWSFLVSAMFSSVFYYYADEFGFPKEFTYAVALYLCIGLIGVGFMKVRYTKFGFVLVFFCYVSFLPIGLIPILLARKAFEDDIRSKLFESYSASLD